MSSTPRKSDKTTSLRPKDSVESLLAKADKILAEVETADIFQSHERREYPTFETAEVQVGDVLGVGGFCVVSQINSFQLSKEGDLQQQTSTNTDEQALPQQKQQPKFQESMHSMDDPDHEEPDDHHYAVETAKRKMARRCQRSGQARYAIKRLDPALSELDRTRGMIDMALEVKYLTVLWHPNIVKMRGYNVGTMMKPDAFFIMDRLYDTLDRRIESWSKQKKGMSGMFGLGKDKAALIQLMAERLIVAYDLAVAFAYMHEHKLVYRDIKQENFGFDIRGDIKVFDFGLAKALMPALRVKRGSKMYRLTPITGSLPYMPPEVAKKEPYNESCDCFSFSFLFYELLALKNTPYHRYCPREYFERVIKGKERPTIHRAWPKLSSKLLAEAWNQDPTKRPHMKNIAKMIRTDMTEICQEDGVLHRTQYMLQRSTRSVEEEPSSSK